MNLPTSITIVIVSDFEKTEQKTWIDEEAALQAFMDQDYEEPFEIVMVENSAFAGSVPESLYRIAPDLKILFTEETQSAKLKDFGVRNTGGELIAVTEADCIPNREWLRILATTFREHPEVDVVSGRTYYGEENSYRRCMNLIDRSFDDSGMPGDTRFVSNNGALYKRSLLECFSYPEAVSPFLSCRLRNRKIRQAGHRLYFQPDSRMRHAIGGLGFIRDLRRNMGYADMMMSTNPRASAIPGLILRRMRLDVRNTWRLGRRYLHWNDWLLLPFLMMLARVFELPGMIDAIRQRSEIPHSAYR